MRVASLLASLAISGHMASAAQSPDDLMRDLQEMATHNLEETENSAQPRKDGQCSLFTAQIRQDW